MTDDIQATGDKAQATSNKPKQPPEPNYQDELDVYEAVLKLEEKYGKKFLTDVQREKLEKAGRIENNIIGNVIFSSSYKASKKVVQTIFTQIETYFPEMVANDTWNKLNDAERGVYRRILFWMRFGCSPEKMELDFSKKF